MFKQLNSKGKKLIFMLGRIGASVGKKDGSCMKHLKYRHGEVGVLRWIRYLPKKLNELLRPQDGSECPRSLGTLIWNKCASSSGILKYFIHSWRYWEQWIINFPTSQDFLCLSIRASSICILPSFSHTVSFCTLEFPLRSLRNWCVRFSKNG